MKPVLDYFFGRNLDREAARYIEQLGNERSQASREKASKFLADLLAKEGHKIALGETLRGEPVEIPTADLIAAHGLVTGGTGSGKTFFGLLILAALLRLLPSNLNIGFGLVDPKGEFFAGALYLVERRLKELAAEDPKAARDLRRRIVIVDFSLPDPVSPYNILSRWSGTDPDFFASSRAELLLDLLPGGDHLSLGASGVLKKLLMLLAEFHLPVTTLDEVLNSEEYRTRLISRCPNRALAAYFVRQFPEVPRSSIAAIQRRIDALFSSESVRLSLAGPTSPDFRLIQDEGRIPLVNCAGAHISRGVRRVLQGTVLTDIRQSVFARRGDCPFLWLLEEAQNFFVSEMLRESMAELLTMARSFRSHFLFFTQNISTAVPDARLLKTLFTNIRWSFSMRGDPADAAFLKPALPVSGHLRRPKASPFEDQGFYTLAEERTMAHESIAALPDRTGYLWFRAGSPEAIKIRTNNLEIPGGRELEQQTQALRRDPTFGGRLSRKDYDRLVEERNRRAGPDSTEDLNTKLANAYRSVHGDKQS